VKPIRLGSIGCGLCATDIHWPTLRKLRDRFEVVHVCSRNEAKAEAFADLTGAGRYTTNHHELLAESVGKVTLAQANVQTGVLRQAAGAEVASPNSQAMNELGGNEKWWRRRESNLCPAS
jgi:ornithine cyclodeaminase/alanine dehydrogenase-like protein (mu-crystallin family)